LPWLILSYISKTLSKGLNWTNPQYISGATVIVDFEVENDKKNKCFFMHQSCIFMSELSKKITHTKNRTLQL
jgi:hypothetical protein